MYVQNLDRLIFEIYDIEVCLSKAILEQNFELYKLLALRYAQLAKQCTGATFEWRF